MQVVLLELWLLHLWWPEATGSGVLCGPFCEHTLVFQFYSTDLDEEDEINDEDDNNNDNNNDNNDNDFDNNKDDDDNHDGLDQSAWVQQ